MLTKLLAWILILLGGAGLIGGAGLMLSLADDPDSARNVLPYVVAFYTMLSLGYFLPAVLSGWGLLRGWGWARGLAVIVCLLLLAAIPVGTVLGAFGLWVLLGSPRRGAPLPADPRSTVPKRFAPRVPPPAPGGPRLGPRPADRDLLATFVAMGAVFAGFVVVLGAGFRLHHQPAPGYLDGGFYPALIYLAVAVVYLVARRPTIFGDVMPRGVIRKARYRREWRRQAEAARAARLAQIAELAAEPATIKYADLIAAGEQWSAEQIAYDREPAARATCRHLQPVEAAMRSAGLPVKLVSGRQVRCPCRVDEAGLRTAVPVDPAVQYREYYLGGRSPQDDPVAYLICAICGTSSIETVHPDEARTATRWFPAPPAA